MVVGVGLIALGVLASVELSRPYRADRELYDGQRWERISQELRKQDSSRARLALIPARDRYADAARLDPWQTVFHETLGRVRYQMADFRPADGAGAAVRLRLLVEARGDFRRALRIDAGSAQLLNEYAEVLIRLSEVDPNGQGRDATQEAAAVLRRAIQANPWHPRAPFVLSLLLDRNGDASGATAVMDRGLRVAPKDPDLLRQAIKLHERAGDAAGAEKLLRRLRAVAPDDPEARQALASGQAQP
jgi:tetratricopeptide (TPR) repeat protein